MLYALWPCTGQAAQEALRAGGLRLAFLRLKFRSATTFFLWMFTSFQTLYSLFTTDQVATREAVCTLGVPIFAGVRACTPF